MAKIYSHALTGLFIFLFSPFLLAQNKGEAASTPKIPFSGKGKASVILSLGTTPGGGIAYGVTDKLNVQLGYDNLVYTLEEQEFKQGNETFKGKGKLDFRNVKLIGEYLPFRKSSFHLFFGAAYLLSQYGEVTGKTSKTYTFNNIEITPEDVGEIYMKADWKNTQIAPLAGFGFGRSVPKRRVGFGVEFGTMYYTQEPQVKFVGTKRLEPMSDNEKQIQENIKDYRFFPIFNLRLTVKLN